MDRDVPLMFATMLMSQVDNSDSNSSSDSSSSDSEIEEILLKRIKIPRISIINYFEDVVQAYSTAEFIRHFHITPIVFQNLRHEYEQSTDYQKMLTRNPNRVLKADKTLAIFLWFAAHEACSYRDISDRFNISLSTVHSAILRGTAFLSNLAPKWISWPTVDEMKKEATERERQSGIPGVIGCLDVTHIVIDPPAENKDDYVDQKGDVSMVVQAVCNIDKKFIDCFIGFPGSVHDSRVLRNSPLYEKLLQLPSGYRLLADSAYPCTTQLLPPYENNGDLDEAEKRFNTVISAQRVDIEHCFGILKQRFRQLYYCKLRGNKLLCHFIRACIVLHNLGDTSDLNFEFADVEQQENDHPVVEANGIMANGCVLRDHICELIIRECNVNMMNLYSK